MQQRCLPLLLSKARLIGGDNPFFPSNQHSWKGEQLLDKDCLEVSITGLHFGWATLDMTVAGSGEASALWLHKHTTQLQISHCSTRSDVEQPRGCAAASRRVGLPGSPVCRQLHHAPVPLNTMVFCTQSWTESSASHWQSDVKHLADERCAYGTE